MSSRESREESARIYEIQPAAGAGYEVGKRGSTGIFYIAARCGLREDAERIVTALNAVVPSYIPALEEQLAYALDALEGHPWTGWTTDDARAVLRERRPAIQRRAA